MPTTRILAIACLTCAIAATEARAEAPSVDAYAGQALVLGAPHHSHGGVNKGPGGTGGVEREGGGETRSTTGSAGSTTGRTSSGSGAPANTGSVAGSKAPSSATRSGSPNGAESGSRSRHSEATPGPAAGAQTQRTPSLTIRPASDSVPLSGLDVSLVIVGVLMLVGTAFALRRTREGEA